IVDVAASGYWTWMGSWHLAKYSEKRPRGGPGNGWIVRHGEEQYSLAVALFKEVSDRLLGLVLLDGLAVLVSPAHDVRKAEAPTYILREIFLTGPGRDRPPGVTGRRAFSRRACRALFCTACGLPPDFNRRAV